MSDKEVQEEKMNCGLSVAQRDLLQARLAGLEETVPPREVWQRIEAQARAEGIFRHRLVTGTRWLAGSGIAAAVVIAVLNVPLTTSLVEESNGNISATPPVEVASTNAVPANLAALMVQSQEIERDLRALPGQPSLMRAGTAATIAELEDRIAIIDYRLNYTRLTPAEAEIYWRERVRLMNSLLNLRRAQAQSMAF
jgi:hypothetical protein